MSDKMHQARVFAAMSQDLRAFGYEEAARAADMAGVCALAGDEVGARANLEQAKELVAEGVFASWKAAA